MNIDKIKSFLNSLTNISRESIEIQDLGNLRLKNLLRILVEVDIVETEKGTIGIYDVLPGEDFHKVYFFLATIHESLSFDGELDEFFLSQLNNKQVFHHKYLANSFITTNSKTKTGAEFVQVDVRDCGGFEISRVPFANVVFVMGYTQRFFLNFSKFKV